MTSERRNAPRIDASLEVHFLGKERRGKMRRGDFSVTGVRLDGLGPLDLGKPGTEERLRLTTRDGAYRAEVHAQVVRVERVEDLEHGSMVLSAGFLFAPRNDEERESVAMLFVHIARSHVRRDEHGLRPASEPPAADDSPSEVQSLSIETDWQLRKGEAVRVELPAPEGGSIAYAGKAVRSRRGKKGTYRTSVEFEAPTGTFAQLESPPTPPVTPDNMTGDLAQIRAPSLLSLASLEHMEGVLHIRRDDRLVSIYLREGQVVDAEETGSSASRRRLIAEVCQWERGSFELCLCEVDRIDGIGVPTPFLLLQLAQLQDEQRRVA